MTLERLRSTWEELGRSDPLWAVLVRPERRGGGWTVDEFLATAAEHVDEVRRLLEPSELRLGQRVLDFGCGAGRLSQGLAVHAPEVVGIDIAGSMIDEANRINRYPDRVSFVHYDGGALPFPDDHFDSAVSLISIQHSPPAVQLACLIELHRVVRPGGALVLQLPTRRLRAEPLSPGAMSARIEPVSVPSTLRAGQRAQVRAAVTNTSGVPWAVDAQLRLGDHWYRAGGLSTWDDARADLAHAVAPGSTVQVGLTVTAPEVAGDYELELDLLQEGVTWWAGAGNPSARVPVTVIEAAGQAPAEHRAPEKPRAVPRGRDEPEMEMHGVPEELVRMLFAHLGGAVVRAAADTLAGDGWESRTYVVSVH